MAEKTAEKEDELESDNVPAEKEQHSDDHKQNFVARLLKPLRRLLEPLVKGQRFTYFAIIVLTSLVLIVVYYRSKNDVLPGASIPSVLIVGVTFFLWAGFISWSRKCFTCYEKLHNKIFNAEKGHSLAGIIIALILGVSIPVVQKISDISVQNLPAQGMINLMEKSVSHGEGGAGICETAFEDVSLEAVSRNWVSKDWQTFKLFIGYSSEKDSVEHKFFGMI